jgi:ATP-dependent DNA helicase Q1
MGIDKPNCRFVIHHTLSKSLENFYQESGRAGRDGQKAYSILFFRFADVFRQASMVFTEQTGLKNLHSIVNYSIDLKECKRVLIGEHFNDQSMLDHKSCMKMCDMCCDKAKEPLKVNVLNECRVVLAMLDRQEKNQTANKICELALNELKKSDDSTSTKINKIQDVERLLLYMLLRDYLKEEFHFTPYNTICYLVCGKRANDLFTDNRINKFEIELLGSDTSKPKKTKKADENDDDIEWIKVSSNGSKKKQKITNSNQDDEILII